MEFANAPVLMTWLSKQYLLSCGIVGQNQHKITVDIPNMTQVILPSAVGI
jgi:hypothetical protein